MLIAMIVLSLAQAAGVPPQTASAGKSVDPVCQTLAAQRAGAVARTPVPRAHALGAEPPADEIAAILYSEGNCIKPVVIREDVGAPGQAASKGAGASAR